MGSTLPPSSRTPDPKAAPVIQRIRSLYLAGHSIRDVAKIMDVGAGLVSYRIRQMRLGRSRSDALRNSVPKRYPDVALTVGIREVVEGNLLGDGSLCDAGSGRGATYTHASKHREHIEWLRELFGGTLKVSRVYRRAPHAVRNAPGLPWPVVRFRESFSFRTQATVSLMAIRHEWYRPVKSVPADLVLTPTKMLHWYLGDGLLSRNGKGALSVVLCSQGFTVEDNNLLIAKLNKQLGIDALLRRTAGGSGVMVYIRSRSRDRFFDLIGDCPPQVRGGLGHRWPVGRGGTA